MTTVGDLLYQLGGVPVNSEFTTGSIFFVDSNTGSNSNDGKSPSTVFATVDYAIGNCTASKGDIIYVMPGHAETVTGSVTADVIGVKVIGLGNGDKRPTITVNAAINGISVTAADNVFYNIRVVAGSSVTAATRLVRIAASNICFIACDFEMAYDMYHMIVTFSGDNINILDSTMTNAVTTSASAHPQKGVLNISGTNVLVKGCRFKDNQAKKAERWRMCVAGGALSSSMVVEECTFICRGQATSTRSAGASDGTGVYAPNMATLYCRAISPSANTAVGTIFNMKYGYQIECYDVAAINKKAVISPTMA